MITRQEAIGGYFELEMSHRGSYHSAALALNTGRNCLEYILLARHYHRVYLPYYSCDVLLEPFNKLDIEYRFYHINKNLELDDPIALSDGEALLYINYFGLKQDYVISLAEKWGGRLIVDNTQAFYALPLSGIDTFYSCRKFFGVADGAYVYCDKRLDMELEQDHSWDRMTHLLKRIDVSTEAAYVDFCGHEEQLKGNPIMMMSPLTHRMMASIDYQQVASRRQENYNILDKALRDKNGIFLPLADDAVPMVYPFLTTDAGLRQRLIDHRIYVAQYWPNVLEWSGEDYDDYQLTKNLLPLPVDQRYDEEDMSSILALI